MAGILPWLAFALFASGAFAGAGSPDAPAGAASFLLVQVQGEVFHVLEGPPKAVNEGQSVVGGKLVVMDEARAQVRFPNGKDFAVAGGSVLYLSADAEDLTNAFAGTMAVRDRTVQFLSPADGAALTPDKSFEVLVGLDPSNPALRDAASFELVATKAGEPETAAGLTLHAFEARSGPAPAASTGPSYRLHHFVTDRGLPAGAYQLQVRSVEETGASKVGKSVRIEVK